MTLAFFMLTVDRRQQLFNYETRPHPPKADRTNYVTQTLNRLYESGCFESRTKWTLDIVDSGSPDDYAVASGIADFVENSYGRVAYHNKGWNEGANANKNFLVGLQTAVARDADYVVLIEDDIDVINGFVDAVADWLADHARLDAHVYVFGAACLPGNPKVESDRLSLDGPSWPTSQEAGEWTYPPGTFMGTQCIALRIGDAQQLGHWLEADKQFNRRKYGYDVDMRRWAEKTYGNNTPFVCTAPSFVQHVGIESAIHLGRFHKFVSFPGHEWRYTRRS